MNAWWLRSGSCALVLAGACSLGCGPTKPPAEAESFDDDSGVITDNDGSIIRPDSGDPFADVVLPEVNVGDGLISGDTACAKSEAAAIKPPVDVIIAVDQSGSMSDDIANVKANINKLSDNLKATGLDYRVVMIGTVGTSTYAICVPPPLGGAACASNPPIFRTVNQNVQSTDALQKIISTYDSTAAGLVWADFIRKESIKAIIPITDDDSRSYLFTTFDTELLKRGAGTFGTAEKRRYVAYPIMGATEADATKVCGSNAVNVGKQYSELAKLTKGKWFPICLKDFAPVFAAIAKDIATTIACELSIPAPPTGEKLDPSKVNVSHTPAGGGASTPILRDDSKPCDMGANGWQYNADKTKILLCGDACTKVKADLGGKVNVEFGCETKFKPPM